MSQYFTYDDLLGHVPIDTITADPVCKTCSATNCFNKYENVQGVSLSKHSYSRSIPLGENDRVPLPAYPCDSSMLGCRGGNLVNADPYGVNTKTTSSCNPSNPKYYNIEVPRILGSLERNRNESPRYVRNKSLRNSSNTSANIFVPISIRDTTMDFDDLNSNYSVNPFYYGIKNDAVPQIRDFTSSELTGPVPMTLVDELSGRVQSKQSVVRPSATPSPVKAVTSPIAVTQSKKPIAVTQSKKPVSVSVKSDKSVGSNVSKVKVPLALSVSTKKK